MQYIDKHLIIERYINGSMSPAEVQNFHTMLETDGELRAMFRAENLLNSSISRDRVALEAADHSRMYAKFLKNLADSIPQGAATASAASSGSGGVASWLANLGTSTKVAVSAAIITGGIAVSAFLYQNAQPEQTAVPTPGIEAPATHAPAVSPNSAVQSAPVVQQPSGGTATVQQRKADVKQSPNSASAQQANVQTAAIRKDSIPEFNQETTNIKLELEK